MLYNVNYAGQNAVLLAILLSIAVRVLADTSSWGLGKNAKRSI
jgi:hypothetical protein